MNKETLFKIKRRLDRLGDKNIGEAQTKESFISPLISALGWDITDFDEVKLEYKHTRKDNPVDYALLIDMIPKLYIEAKQLGANLEDRKWNAQVLTYATMAGVKWALLADGNHYKLYNTMAEAKLEEKLFYEWKMKDITENNVDNLLNFLNLLSKEKFQDDEIEIAWQNHFEVAKVEKTLRKIINDRDDVLLNLIRRKTKLRRATVVNSLNKLKINIEKLHTTDLIAPKPEGEVVKAKIKDEAAPERHKIRYEWWEQLIKRAGQMTDLHVGLSPSKYHYIGKKRHGFLFAYVIASNFGQVELYIDNGTNSKAENESRFDKLYSMRSEIQDKFGDSLHWDRIDERRACRISKRIDIGGYADKEKWIEIQDAMIDAMCRLERAFKPYIKNL